MHYYLYWIHAQLGLIHLRVPTWLPLWQVYFNGHKWLANQLKAAGIAYEMSDNAFSACADWQRAQQLVDSLEAKSEGQSALDAPDMNQRYTPDACKNSGAKAETRNPSVSVHIDAGAGERRGFPPLQRTMQSELPHPRPLPRGPRGEGGTAPRAETTQRQTNWH